jgi:hypothetical protein
MSRARQTRMLRRVACALALGVTAAAIAGCRLEVGAEGPAGYEGDYPSDGYIATTDPMYFEGHATYWYGDRWYYRDGGAWRHYDREPPALYERRIQAPPRRRTYEPSWGRPAGHSTGHPGPAGGRSDGRRRSRDD